jgi:hypothetical protein
VAECVTFSIHERRMFRSAIMYSAAAYGAMLDGCPFRRIWIVKISTIENGVVTENKAPGDFLPGALLFGGVASI